MGNVCNCVKGADSKSLKSGQTESSSKEERNGSPQDAVEKTSQEKTKAGGSEPLPNTTEVELEIAPLSSGANKTQPTQTTSVPSDIEDKNAPETVKIEEKSSEEVVGGKKPSEVVQDDLVAGTGSIETEKIPETSVESSAKVDDVETHSPDEKASTANNAEVPEHNTNLVADEGKITKSEEVEVTNIVEAPLSETVAIVEEKTEDVSTKIEKEDAPVEVKQGDLETPIQAVLEEHELPTEVSSKPEVEVIRAPSPNKPDDVEPEAESSVPDDAEKSLIGIKSSDEGQEGNKSLPGKDEVQVETPSALDIAEASPQLSVKEEQEPIGMEETHENIESVQQVKPSIDPEPMETFEAIPDHLTKDKLLEPEVENRNLKETQLELSQSTEDVPSNTPTHAAFLLQNKTNDDEESTTKPESSLLEEVQKYVEDMVSGSVAAVQEEELPKENESNSAENNNSASHDEENKTVNSSESDKIASEDLSLDAEIRQNIDQNEENVVPIVTQEAAILEEDQALASKQKDTDVTVKDEESLESEKTSEDTRYDLEQPNTVVDVAAIEENVEQTKDIGPESNSPSPDEESEISQHATQAEAEEDTQTEAEEIIQTEAEEVTEANADEITQEVEEVTQTKTEDVSQAEVDKVNPVEAEELAQAEAEDATQVETEEITHVEAEVVTEAEAEEVTEAEEDIQAETEKITQGDAEELTQSEVEEVSQGEAETITQAQSEGTAQARTDLSIEEESQPADGESEKPSTPTVEVEEPQKISSDLELSIENPEEQQETIKTVEEPEEVLAATSDDVVEQATTTDESGGDSIMDSMLSFLQEKFSSSSLQEADTEA